MIDPFPAFAGYIDFAWLQPVTYRFDILVTIYIGNVTNMTKKPKI